MSSRWLAKQAPHLREADALLNLRQVVSRFTTAQNSLTGTPYRDGERSFDKKPRAGLCHRARPQASDIDSHPISSLSRENAFVLPSLHQIGIVPNRRAVLAKIEDQPLGTIRIIVKNAGDRLGIQIGVNELAYSYAKRANDLIESMNSLMLSDRLVPSIILARALVETTAMGRYFIEKMESGIRSADFPKIENFFYRFYAGSRLGNAKIRTIHVNDALRELEEIDLQYVSYLAGKHQNLWISIGNDPVQTFKDRASLLKTYDKLSEISHPNGLGTQYLYPASDAPDNTDVVAYYRYMTGIAIWQTHHLVTALERFSDFPDRFVATFPKTTRFSADNPLNGTSR